MPVIYGRHLRRILDHQGHETNWNQPEPIPPTGESLILDLGCDVTEAPVAWLWEGRIPRGGLTLLAAQETQTASLVALDLAARVSRDAAWPDAAGAPAAEGSHAGPQQTPAVVYFSPQQIRASHTIPALRAAGADMSRVLCLDGVCRFLSRGTPDAFPIPRVRPLQLPLDRETLRHAIRELREVQLLVFDPIEAFFHRYGNSHTPQDTADVLRDLAWDFGLAVVAVTRLKPAAGNRRAVPAIANPKLAAAAAASWGIVASTRGQQQHLLFPIHCEVANPGPALTFNLAGAPELPGIQWNAEPFKMTAADFADERNASVKFAIAASWLQSRLMEGPRSTEEIQKQARQFGISANMIWNLKKHLRIKSEKSEFQGKSVWRLPVEKGAVEKGGQADDNRPQAPMIEERPRSLAETAEISNPRGSEAAPED